MSNEIIQNLGDAPDHSLLSDSPVSEIHSLLTTSTLSDGAFDINDDTAPIASSLNKARDVMLKTQGFLQDVNVKVQGQIVELKSQVSEPEEVVSSAELKKLKQSFKLHKAASKEHNESLQDAQTRYDTLQREVSQLGKDNDTSLIATKKVAIAQLAAEIKEAEEQRDSLETEEKISKAKLTAHKYKLQGEAQNQAEREKLLEKLQGLSLAPILKMPVVSSSAISEVEQDPSVTQKWNRITSLRSELTTSLTGFMHSNEELYSGDLSQLEADINKYTEGANSLSVGIQELCKLDELLFLKSKLLKSQEGSGARLKALKVTKADTNEAIKQINDMMSAINNSASILGDTEEDIKPLKKELRDARNDLKKELKSNAKERKDLRSDTKEIRKSIKTIDKEISGPEQDFAKLASAKKLSGNYSKHISLLSDISKAKSELDAIKEQKNSLEVKRQKGLSRQASFIAVEEEASDVPDTRPSSPVHENDVSLADELGAFDSFAEKPPVAASTPKETKHKRRDTVRMIITGTLEQIADGTASVIDRDSAPTMAPLSSVVEESSTVIEAFELSKPTAQDVSALRVAMSNIAPAKSPEISSARLVKTEANNVSDLKPAVSNIDLSKLPEFIETTDKSDVVKATKTKVTTRPAEVVVTESDAPSAKRARIVHETVPASVEPREESLNANNIMQFLNNMVASNPIFSGNNVADPVSIIEGFGGTNHATLSGSGDILDGLPSEVSNALLELLSNMHASKPENVTRDHTVSYNNEGRSNIEPQVYKTLASFLGGENNTGGLSSSNTGINMSSNTQHMAKQALSGAMGERPSLLSNASTDGYINSDHENHANNGHKTQDLKLRAGRRHLHNLVIDMVSAA